MAARHRRAAAPHAQKPPHIRTSTTTRFPRSWRGTRAPSPQRVFVSASMRPYLLASLIHADPERPALVVAGDDRAARDLAADLKTPFSARARCASIRRAACATSPISRRRPISWACVWPLSMRSSGEAAAVLVTSAVALAKKLPDPALRPHGFEIEKGGLLDLDEVAGPAGGLRLRARGAGGGPGPVRPSAATFSTSIRPPRNEPFAVSCSTSRSSA